MLPASSAGGGGGVYQILLPEHKTWETMTKTSKAWIFRIAEALEKFQDTGEKLPFFPGEQAQGPVQFRDLDSFPAAARKARHCSRGESWTPPHPEPHPIYLANTLDKWKGAAPNVSVMCKRTGSQVLCCVAVPCHPPLLASPQVTFTPPEGKAFRNKEKPASTVCGL